MRDGPMPAILFGAGIIVGAGFMLVAMPVPGDNKSCLTMHVSKKVATAYVLRPPPAPEPEKIVVREACVTPKPENVTQPELTNTDDTQKPARHRKRHRYRRYWR